MARGPAAGATWIFLGLPLCARRDIPTLRERVATSRRGLESGNAGVALPATPSPAGRPTPAQAAGARPESVGRDAAARKGRDADRESRRSSRRLAGCLYCDSDACSTCTICSGSSCGDASNLCSCSGHHHCCSSGGGDCHDHGGTCCSDLCSCGDACGGCHGCCGRRRSVVVGRSLLLNMNSLGAAARRAAARTRSPRRGRRSARSRRRPMEVAATSRPRAGSSKSEPFQVLVRDPAGARRRRDLDATRGARRPRRAETKFCLRARCVSERFVQIRADAGPRRRDERRRAHGRRRPAEVRQLHGPRPPRVEHVPLPRGADARGGVVITSDIYCRTR